jgi:outer membrane murein-binding lipoprotein Lpp
MSAAAWVWFAVGLATLIVMGGVILALIRQVKDLSATVRRFQQEVEPVLEQIRSQSENARSRSEELPSRVPRRGPGARLRR